MSVSGSSNTQTIHVNNMFVLFSWLAVRCVSDGARARARVRGGVPIVHDVRYEIEN